jgi:flagellar hook-associated protein 2
VASASYASIAAQVSAIQSASGYEDLLFTVAENSDSDGITFTYKIAGSVASTPTFTGTASTHTITNPTVGISVLTPVAGVAAKYDVTGVASETTTLVVSDGSTTVSVSSAAYTSIAEQVTAIKAGSGYDNLKFTVASNGAGNGFEFTYKTTGAVSSAPTLTGTGSSHSVTTDIAGVTPVNSSSTTTISVGTDTPSGVVKAINQANTGVTATLIDTGTGSNTYKILLSGQTGSNGVFTLTASPDLGFHDTANSLQTAQDSIIKYEGINVTRDSNSITDIIEGVTLNLLSVTASDVSLTISNDRSTLKTSIEDMVQSYNDLLLLFDNFTAEETEAEMSGALSEDSSLLRFLTNKIRTTIFSDSSTPSGSLVAIRDLGISTDQYGKMQFDATTYDAAVLVSYDDIVTMLTADTSGQYLFDSNNKGLAQDIATVLEDLTDSTGVVSNRETSAATKLVEHEDNLIKLQARMDSVYERYLMQFGVMENLMATLDSTKDYLTTQFEAMSKVYEN